MYGYVCYVCVAMKKMGRSLDPRTFPVVVRQVKYLIGRLLLASRPIHRSGYIENVLLLFIV